MGNFKLILVNSIILLALVLCVACNTKVTESLYSSRQKEIDTPFWIQNLESAKIANQLFVVAALDDDATTAFVSLHEKDSNGNWKQLLSTPGFVGKNGLCDDIEHKEGCGQTPKGIYHFNKAFGLADDPGCKIPYVKVTDDLYWSGDQNDGMHYNKMVSIKDYPDLDKDNSEHLIDYDTQYQYCLNISFNENGEKGRGSAIFLHCIGPNKPYTGGCVAIPENKMKLVMQKVKSDCVVIIDTLKNLNGDLDSLSAANPNVLNEKDDVISEDGMKFSNDSSGFVLLSDVVPDAILEIRYYSTYNFVGERIDGYEEPIAMITKEAATKLNDVSDELNQKGYRLKIYDAYRPQMAVSHFVRWAKDLSDVKMKKYFYPDLEKDVLFPQGYIAEHSGHSRGSTVDLTLFDMNLEKEVDMGGTFDFFGEESHPDYTGITTEQYTNRMILREAMLNHGFKPLDEEWWHFTLKDEPYTDTYFTFPNSKKLLK